MNYIKIHSRSDIETALAEILEKVSHKKQEYFTARAYENNALVSKSIFSLLKEIYGSSSGLSSLISGVLMEHIFESENECPGSGPVTLDTIISQNSTAVKSSDFYDLRLTNFKSCLDFLSISDEAKEIIIDIIELAGLHGKIFVERSKTPETLIELKESYNFSLLLPIGPFFGEKKWEKNNCRCLCVDGVIETLGEIDGILQAASSDKAPLVIFARGFSYDVINTIKVNNDRQTIDVMLVSFGVDNLDTLNSIVDIAAILNSDIVTPTKGDAIASREFSDLPIVEKIICGSGAVSIVNSAGHARVNSHVSNLSKRANTSHGDIKKLLEKRMASLTGKCVIAKIRCESIQKQNLLMEEIDSGLKIANSLIKFGIIDGMPAILPQVSLKFSKRFNDCINSLDIAILRD